MFMLQSLIMLNLVIAFELAQLYMPTWLSHYIYHFNIGIMILLKANRDSLLA